MLKIPSKRALFMLILVITPKHMKFQGPKFKDQHGSNFLFVLPMKILKESPSKVGYFRTIVEIFRYIQIHTLKPQSVQKTARVQDSFQSL